MLKEKFTQKILDFVVRKRGAKFYNNNPPESIMKNYIPKFIGSSSDIKKARIVLENSPDVDLSTEYKLHTPEGIDSLEDIERWADSRDISTAEARVLLAVSETLKIAHQKWEDEDWWVIDEEAIESRMIAEGWNEED